MANLFDVFTVSFGKAKDARIAELEGDLALRTTQRDTAEQSVIDRLARIRELEGALREQAEGHTTIVSGLDSQIVELKAELAPFREYVAANAAEAEAQADGAASPPAQVAKPKK